MYVVKRPPKKTAVPQKEDHTEVVMIRMKPEQKSAFQVEAERRGLTLSAWLRMIALEAIAPKV